MGNIIQIKRGYNEPTIEQLNPYELGFCTKDKLVYINPDDDTNACIPVGCMPNSFTYSNGTITLSGKGFESMSVTIPDADGSNKGLITATEQTLGGKKTFTGQIVGNNGVQTTTLNASTNIQSDGPITGTNITALGYFKSQGVQSQNGYILNNNTNEIVNKEMFLVMRNNGNISLCLNRPS